MTKILTPTDLGFSPEITPIDRNKDELVEQVNEALKKSMEVEGNSEGVYIEFELRGLEFVTLKEAYSEYWRVENISDSGYMMMFYPIKY